MSSAPFPNALHFRILAILVGLGALLALTAYTVLNNHVYSAFDHYEQDLAATELSRVEQAIDAHMDALALMNRDYSEWDKLYNAVLAPQSMPDFVDEEMYADQWPLLGIELVLVLDADGQIIWGQLAEAEGEDSLTLDDVVLPLVANNPLLSSEAAISSHTRGLIDTPAGLMMIVSAPILHTDGSGPVAGSFIVGSFFTDEKIAQFAKSAEADVTLFFMADSELSDRVREVPLELNALGKKVLARSAGDRLYMLSQLRDLYGDAVAVVQTTTDGRLQSIGSETVAGALKSLLLGIGSFVLMAWLLLVLVLPTGSD